MREKLDIIDEAEHFAAMAVGGIVEGVEQVTLSTVATVAHATTRFKRLLKRTKTAGGEQRPRAGSKKRNEADVLRALKQTSASVREHRSRTASAVKQPEAMGKNDNPLFAHTQPAPVGSEGGGSSAAGNRRLATQLSAQSKKAAAI